MPIVVEGERENNLKIGTHRLCDGTHRCALPIEVRDGATSFWFTDL